jgi:D-3-phosphoglycerate dehydrogenase / 2-oxoglutarate reductase
MTMLVAIGPSSFAESDPAPRRLLDAAGLQVRENPFGRRLTEEEIITQLDGVDGLLAGLEPLNRRVIASAAPRLKAIARVGIGTANVDFAAAEEFGVKVSNTPDAPAQAVAEMTLCAMLALARQILPMNAALHAGKWEKAIGLGLSGANLLLIGYGRIGRRVAALAKAFGARVLVYDPYLPEQNLEDVTRVASLEAALAEADIVSLHASGEDCLLDSAAFMQMKEGVLLLNSARGGLVEESALVAALDAGRVGGLWFDAFTKEPYDGPLTRYPQALLTPHTGTYTRQCRLEMETAAVHNLLRDLGIE